MHFTEGKWRKYEQLMKEKPGFDRRERKTSKSDCASKKRKDESARHQSCFLKKTRTIDESSDRLKKRNEIKGRKSNE